MSITAKRTLKYMKYIPKERHIYEVITLVFYGCGLSDNASDS